MNHAEKRMSRTGVVFGCALICCFLWGSAAPSIKIGYRLFDIAAADSMAQIVFAGMRFMLAGVMVILAGSFLNRREGGGKLLKPQKAFLPMILKLAMVQTVAQYVFYYIGLAHTTGVKAAIIGGSNVFLSIFIAVAVFHMERLTLRKLLGCAVELCSPRWGCSAAGGLIWQACPQADGCCFFIWDLSLRQPIRCGAFC